MLRQICCCLILLAANTALAETRPNILIIWGEELDYRYMTGGNEDIRGCWTPNIDRIALEGALFTDAYGEPVSTAARAAFITGQSPSRTGLARTAIPGAGFGLRTEDPTIAEYLKTKGYMTAKFGRYHLGDRDAYLPTNHGFDEFLGSLYDLDADIESRHIERPTAEQAREHFEPRGVIRSFADGRIEDTGPLSRERMQNLDQEVTDGALEFIERATAVDTPFFVWWSSTRSHVGDDENSLENITERVFEHDNHVGQLLAMLDELGIADNTIVVYSSDNGARVLLSPDSGAAPDTGSENEAPEGHYRVPLIVRWPGVIEPGTQISEVVSQLDWFPTFAAALGDSDFTESLKHGIRIGKKRVEVHLDGYNVLPYLRGTEPEWPREEYFYFSDTGDVLGVRYDDWKIIFSDQHASQAAEWTDPYVLMHAPRLINLREDPVEAELDEATGRPGWYIDRLHVLAPTQNIVGEFLISFEEFPPPESAADGFSFARLFRVFQP